jgi:hypothetical protein
VEARKVKESAATAVQVKLITQSKQAPRRQLSATEQLIRVAIFLGAAIFLMIVMAEVRSHAAETPVYDANGHYAGSVHDYGRTQTFTDRNGHFTGSAINQGNGMTSFYGPRGNFAGSAGSSIDRAFNFGRGR